MVIIFENEKARKYLLKEGFVYTLRKRKRKRIGKDWMTDRRQGHKIADVHIEEVGSWTGKDWRILEPFVKDSGFTSIEEWMDVVTEFSRGEMPKRGWIYRVYITKVSLLDKLLHRRITK